ncbi:hypothetical protein B0H16DRAFT_1578581 [Mycena metata]|uniref:Uncharacterized protein n=1 Tax=Mycena metata TaxID=1033252 RepID=A0AAD7MVE0_9AGAR|nr:hypothetical protein B0H16DRAFT_1578581 [Mycena metata]
MLPPGSMISCLAGFFLVLIFARKTILKIPFLGLVTNCGCHLRPIRTNPDVPVGLGSIRTARLRTQRLPGCSARSKTLTILLLTLEIFALNHI